MRWLVKLCVAFLSCSPFVGLASQDQHSVEAIVVALQAPISAQEIENAQKIDDEIIKKGELDGEKVYIVTDSRLSKAKEIVAKITEFLDKDRKGWVVRVLDTNPKQINAFVTGGKYIYVFTGLIENVQSDDELAFVLSHEIGHSFLKHHARMQNDKGLDSKNLLLLGALLSKKHADTLIGTAEIMTASYSQKDEEEADAIAVVLAKRAGYDSMRGIDFFSRSKKKNSEINKMWNDGLEADRAKLQEYQKKCLELVNNFNKGLVSQTAKNSESINKYCADVERNRLEFNQKVAQFNQMQAQEVVEPFFSSHPMDQARIAAIAASVDMVDGARSVASLTEYVQTQRVFNALIKANIGLFPFEVNGKL